MPNATPMWRHQQRPRPHLWYHQYEKKSMVYEIFILFFRISIFYFFLKSFISPSFIIFSLKKKLYIEVNNINIFVGGLFSSPPSDFVEVRSIPPCSRGASQILSWDIDFCPQKYVFFRFKVNILNEVL